MNTAIQPTAIQHYRLALALLFLALWGFTGRSADAQSSPFTECPATPNVDNATVRLLETVNVEFPNGATQFTTGDEIAFFTGDGVCAGRTEWVNGDPDSRVVTVSGPASTVDPTEVDGYTNGEALQMSVWQQSTDRRFDVDAADVGYTPCDGTEPLCRDDGLYESNVVFTIEAVGSGVLPVELSSFALRLRDDRVHATWRTLTETDNSGFTLQHRSDTTRAWAPVGFVQGRGTTTTPQTYGLATPALAYGTHRFRLLQHDYDGTTTEIAQQTIVYRLTEVPLVLSIAPQPVRTQATLTLTTATTQHTRVELFDLLGRHVRILHEGPLRSSTPHTIPFDTAGLSAGQYIVRVQSGADHLSRRVVVLR